VGAAVRRQGLTLVNFLAQPEPILTQNVPKRYPRHSLIPPGPPCSHPRQPLNAPPIPHKALMLSRKVDECKPLFAGRLRGGGAGLSATQRRYNVMEAPVSP